MPQLSKKVRDKCNDLKQKLSEFHPAKSVTGNQEDHPYVIEWEQRNHYCVFSKRYTETVKGVSDGTVKEIFKVVHSKYALKNKEYIAGDVLCGDSVVRDGVCFNVLKEPVSEWTNEYHYKYLFNKDLILTRTSDFYNGYIKKQEETEVIANAAAGGAENAAVKLGDMEEQLQNKKEETDNMKEQVKEMSDYIAELEKWIENVRKETAKLPNRLFQKLNPQQQQGGAAAGPSGKGKGLFGGVFGGKKK